MGQKKVLIPGDRPPCPSHREATAETGEGKGKFGTGGPWRIGPETEISSCSSAGRERRHLQRSPLSGSWLCPQQLEE